MAYTLKVVRGLEIFRVPLETQEAPTFQDVDLALRRLWPETGADVAWYTSGTSGIYMLEEPIFGDFLATAKKTGIGNVLRLEIPAQKSSQNPMVAAGIVDSHAFLSSPVAAADADDGPRGRIDSCDSETLSPAEHQYWNCPMCDEINRADRQCCNNCGIEVPPEMWGDSTANLAPLSHPRKASKAYRSSPEKAEDDLTSSSLSPTTEFGTSSSSTCSLYISPVKLHRVKSETLLAKWLDKGRGICAALPEYERAAQTICIAPELMSSSRLWQHLKFLKQQKVVTAPYEDVVTSVIHKAYGTKYRCIAKYKAANIPGLGSGNLLEGAVHYYHSLQWERPYLVQALSHLCESEDPDGLQLILGLMLSGSGWCHARKTFVFNTIVSRVKVPLSAADDLLAHPDDDADLQAARRSLMEVVTEFIEDSKDLAVKSTFLEPCKMFFRAKDEPVRENQVDVHGSNTYLAILSATLGVQLNRRPYLGDYSIGCVDFLANGAPEPLAWSESHFGRDWEGVGELRHEEGRFGEDGPKPLRTPGIFDRIEFFSDTFLLQSRTGFVFKGATARDVANAAVNPASSKDKRLRLARYLEKFASWFSEDFILPRMISRITGDTGRLEALQTLKDDLVRVRPDLAGDEGEEDVRFWLWDMSDLPAQFRQQRAVDLMRHVGVLHGGSE